MEYTEFGKTQLRVSRMCLGTWGIGGGGGGKAGWMRSRQQ